MTDDNKPASVKPRELWITWKPWAKDPLGPCTNVLKYVADFDHSPSLHVIEYSAYTALQAELTAMTGERDVLENCNANQRVYYDLHLAALEREAKLMEALRSMHDVCCDIELRTIAREAVEENKKAKETE